MSKNTRKSGLICYKMRFREGVKKIATEADRFTFERLYQAL